MPSKKITISSVKALSPGQTIWDTELKGFGCRARSSGKVFVFKYTFSNRQRFYTIGRWDGGLTPDQARRKAENLRAQINNGIDPMAEKQRVKAIPLTKDAFEKYLEEIKAKRSKRTHAEYQRLFEKFIKQPLGNYKVNAISQPDIARIHNDLKDTPYQGNRVLAVLSSFFSWCIANRHKDDQINPCLLIEKYKEKGRERLLSEQELFQLGKALNAYEEEQRFIKPMKHQKKKDDPEINIITPYVTAAIRLIIMTGARVNEILSLKWENVDFRNKQIRLQESKTGAKSIYLSAPALQLLSEIPRIQGNPHVICGRNEGAHLVNIKDPWRKIRKSAGLDDVRLHDLRHNYASTAVAAGQHLKVIGTLLGHKDTQTTERYAHLANDPLQAANELINKRILEAMSQELDEGNIVKLQG